MQGIIHIGVLLLALILFLFFGAMKFLAVCPFHFHHYHGAFMLLLWFLYYGKINQNIALW